MLAGDQTRIHLAPHLMHGRPTASRPDSRLPRALSAPSPSTDPARSLGPPASASTRAPSDPAASLRLPKRGRGLGGAHGARGCARSQLTTMRPPRRVIVRSRCFLAECTPPCGEAFSLSASSSARLLLLPRLEWPFLACPFFAPRAERGVSPRDEGSASVIAARFCSSTAVRSFWSVAASSALCAAKAGGDEAGTCETARRGPGQWQRGGHVCGDGKARGSEARGDSARVCESARLQVKDEKVVFSLLRARRQLLLVFAARQALRGGLRHEGCKGRDEERRATGVI